MRPQWATYYDDADYFWGSGGRAPYEPRGGYWWLEIGVPFNVVYDNEKIRHELTAHALGVWDWMKNRDEKMRERCANYVLDWIGQVPGKRESRRIMGQHLINENELGIFHQYPDEIATAVGSLISIHPVAYWQKIARPWPQKATAIPLSAARDTWAPMVSSCVP